VLAVHDIGPLDESQYFSVPKNIYLSRAVPRSLAAATVVTVPSAWVAQQLIGRFAIAEERVAVLPSTYTSGVPPSACTSDVSIATGVSGQRRECGAEAQETLAQSRLEALLPDGKPFVLYPAATYPHKNHEMLIEAHRVVWQRHREPLLVLTGGAGRAHRRVEQLVAQSSGVIHLGWVPEQTRVDLIAGAAAVVFPSKYEGFGLPVLEAMAAATPVIASSAAALPEVVADAGTLIDPDDLDGWVDALLEVRLGSAGITAAVQRGLKRAEMFSPERAAERLLDVWRRAMTLDTP